MLLKWLSLKLYREWKQLNSSTLKLVWSVWVHSIPQRLYLHCIASNSCSDIVVQVLIVTWDFTVFLGTHIGHAWQFIPRAEHVLYYSYVLVHPPLFIVVMKNNLYQLHAFFLLLHHWLESEGVRKALWSQVAWPMLANRHYHNFCKITRVGLDKLLTTSRTSSPLIPLKALMTASMLCVFLYLSALATLVSKKSKESISELPCFKPSVFR